MDLTDILFQTFLALMDIHENHKVTPNDVESAAMALKAGCDLNAGFVYRSIMEAYEQGTCNRRGYKRSC